MVGENKLKVYIDTSALNRIFDDQTHPRIYLESSAVLILFEFIEKEIIQLISSDVLLYENSRNPFEERKIFVSSVISKAKKFVEINTDILKKAKDIENTGIKGLDSIHLACAEISRTDYFVTCDDRIIKKYNGKPSVFNPIDFVNDVLLKIIEV
ncbi:MAG: PIN domain-containing protein [Candidatus Acididesulfobacter diazotrophicus]|jgi:predicted nucleic acid-binding protein|uniref:PIN domain-containing protein n=1 Tax=Candidatus Acididesulfobacter diazotrophicus TaxID=2597226 RepID=A0A519BPC3_9DELT|nr:MAG: PIN domain-containing protein [Candidatus Acididesulfobacter diazotrophicus]